MKFQWLLFFFLSSFISFTFQIRSHTKQKDFNLSIKGNIILNIFRNNTEHFMINKTMKEKNTMDIKFEDYMKSKGKKYDHVEIDGILYTYNEAVKLYYQQIGKSNDTNHTVNSIFLNQNSTLSSQINKTIHNCSIENNEIWDENLNQCIDNPISSEMKYSSIIYYNNLNKPKVDSKGNDIFGYYWNESYGISSLGVSNSFLTGRYLYKKYQGLFNNNNLQLQIDNGDINSNIIQNALLEGLYSKTNTNKKNSTIVTYSRKTDTEINEDNPFSSSYENIDSNESNTFYEYLQKTYSANSYLKEKAFSFDSCNGVLQQISSNKESIQYKLQELTHQIHSIINITSLIKTNKVTVDIMSQFISSYFLHQALLSNNSITSNITIPTNALSLMKEFYLAENIYLYYGEGEVKKYLLSFYANSILDSMKQKISNEKSQIEELIAQYNNNHSSNISYNYNGTNLSIDIPNEKTFFGLIDIFDRLTNNAFSSQYDIFTLKSIISFDLYKKKITNFDLSSYITSFNYSLIHSEEKQKELNYLFNNTQLYYVKVYVNNEVIYDDYFDSFEKKLKADIKISKSDIYTYCKEEKPKRGFMIACISLGIILFGEFFALLLLNYYKLKFKN